MRIRRLDHRLRPAERRAYEADGFFVRKAVFQEHELQELRRAVEHAAARIQAAGEKPEEVYWIDGNRYAEAGGTTIQYEHLPESGTLRVLEPFHHLDPAFERLIDDPRVVLFLQQLILIASQTPELEQRVEQRARAREAAP